MTDFSKLKGWILSWKKTFFAKKTVATFFSALGAFWFLIEFSNWILKRDDWDFFLRSNAVWFFVASIAWTLFQRKPVRSVSERLNNSDIVIEIRIANLFDIDSHYVISTNSSFDTEISNNLISAKSVQGAFTERYYSNNDHLEIELSKALKTETVIHARQSKVNGKTEQYKIGTVIKLQPKPTKSAYLVAISDLNEHGTAVSSFENVKYSLATLWNYVSSRGSTEPLAIPVIGTGHGRIPTPRDKVIKEIIQSFIAACSERAFVKKLTIVIAPQDYDNNLNIHELHDFLKYVCRYTEIGNQYHGTGSPII